MGGTELGRCRYLPRLLLRVTTQYTELRGTCGHGLLHFGKDRTVIGHVCPVEGGNRLGFGALSKPSDVKDAAGRLTLSTTLFRITNICQCHLSASLAIQYPCRP